MHAYTLWMLSIIQYINTWMFGCVFVYRTPRVIQYFIWLKYGVFYVHEICVKVLIAFLMNKIRQPSCVVDVIVQFTFGIRRDWTHFWSGVVALKTAFKKKTNYFIDRFFFWLSCVWNDCDLSKNVCVFNPFDSFAIQLCAGSISIRVANCWYS